LVIFAGRESEKKVRANYQIIRLAAGPASKTRRRGGFVVIAYRLYRLDREGRGPGPPQIVECEDDDAVLIEARAHVDGHDIEIWRDNRRVGLIPADR